MNAKHDKGKAGHHPKATAAEAEPAAGAAAFARLEARIRATAPAAALTLDVEAAAVTALGVAHAMTGDAATHAALKAMSRIEVAGKKVFDVRAVDDLGDLALAVRELRKRADAAIAKASRAKLPANVVSEAKTLEKRMQRVCENTLEGVADDPAVALQPRERLPTSGPSVTGRSPHVWT